MDDVVARLTDGFPKPADQSLAFARSLLPAAYLDTERCTLAAYGAAEGTAHPPIDLADVLVALARADIT